MSRLLLVVACCLPLTVAHASAGTSSQRPASKIVYSSMWGPNVNNPEIYSIQADGSGRRNLSQNQGWDGGFVMSPTGDRIAFTSHRPDSGPDELYVMRADGTDLHVLTPPGQGVTSATWSPDGRRLAFAGWGQDGQPNGIWVVDADGANLRQVTPDGRNPVWAPTGNRVAFSGDQALFLDVVNVDTGDRIRVASDSVSSATWSPDGQMLAYAYFGNSLYRVDSAGGTPVRLVLDETHGVSNPAWSPTGEKIAFTSNDSATLVKTVAADGGPISTVSTGEHPVWSPDGQQIASAEYSEILAANADGSGRRVVRSEPRARITFGPAWSPDGHTLLYASMISDNDRELYTVDPAGSQRRQLTKNRVDDVQPAWSPDHKRIAFVRKGRDGESVWVMGSRGGNQHRLRPGRYPSWSPGGRRIAYENGGVVYTMNDRGRRVRRIASGEQPVWAPRGRKIALLRGKKLFVVDTRTRKARLLEDFGTDCAVYGEGDPATVGLSRPEWSPRGTRILMSLFCDYYRSSYLKLWVIGLGGEGVIDEVPILVAPVSRLAWSPDGKRLAFSTPPQGKLNQFHYRTIDAARFDGTGESAVTTGAGDDHDLDW
jgi:TolB protein